MSKVNKLSSLYSTVPNYHELIKAVNTARMDFENDLADFRFDGDKDSSVLHSFKDVEVQAFIVSIPSNNFKEMVNKSYFVYVTHFIDDFFDRPDLPPTPEFMKYHRKDFDRVVENVPILKFLVKKMESRSKNKKMLSKGLHRLMYGGLIPLSQNDIEQDVFLMEFKELGCRFLDNELSNQILEIRDVAYWMTAKTIQEVFLSVENHSNATLAEIWSLLYAPGLYLHDYEEEIENNEINFFNKPLPQVQEMLMLMELVSRNIDKKDELLFKRLDQLKFFNKAFASVYPIEIAEKYKEIEIIIESYLND